MVYEFPELQGLMGRYYYLALNHPSRRGLAAAPQDEGGDNRKAKGPHPEEPSRSEGVSKDVQQIADAIRDHYLPKGADDDVPTEPVSVAVALADKLATLNAFWAIKKKPTGSSDPFALRRAALGVTELALRNQSRLPIRKLIHSCQAYEGSNGPIGSGPIGAGELLRADAEDLLSFFHERLKVYLKDKGHKYDAIDAVLAKADGSLEDDLVLIVRKLEALEAFLKTDDGAHLAAGYKRAANIVKAEEKKDVGRMQSAGAGAAKSAAALDEKLLQQAEEKALFAAMKPAEAKSATAVAAEKFAEAMTALASLRAPIDAFFDKVTVNAEDEDLRANRLALLKRFIAATASVADLSKIEG